MCGTTEVAQSSFANYWGNLQTDANSGCDLDFFSDTNADNVLTKSTSAINFWRAKFNESKLVQTILLIQNTHTYVGGDYSNNWLKTYKITVGNDLNGDANAVCVAENTIWSGGWFDCGKTGRYLSIISSTESIAFSEIMAYEQ